MYYQIPYVLRNDFETTISNRRGSITTTRTCPWHTRRISDLSDVQLACYEIYKKSTLFSQGGRLGGMISRRDLSTYPATATVLNNLAQKIWAYFNLVPSTPNTQKDFDRFHDELCRSFIRDYNAVAPNLPNATYGNAQKIVNMVFKYLTCYLDYDHFVDLFSHCHMPIDTHILYELKMDYSIANITASRIRNRKTGKYSYAGYYRYVGCDYPWSQLTREAYLSLLNDYRAVIGPYLIDAVGNYHTYFELEYYLWDATAKGITFTGIPAGGTLATPIAQFCM